MKPLPAAACVVAVLIVLFFAVPMIAGANTNVCQALAQQKVSGFASGVAGGTGGPVYNTINSVGQSAATGKVATAVVSNEHPNSPAPVSCAYDYWKGML